MQKNTIKFYPLLTRYNNHHFILKFKKTIIVFLINVNNFKME